MREIKFRVWNDFIKKYETLQEVASRGDIMPRGNELKTTVNYPLIIEQFTGLHDKNGVEIYEGDIVRYTESYERKDEKDAVFEEEVKIYPTYIYPFVEDTWYGVKHSEYEVISNIHEEVVE